MPKYSALRTRVTIDITPTEDGCQLDLTHHGVLPEWQSQTESGWGMILESLETVLTGEETSDHEPGEAAFEV